MIKYKIIDKLRLVLFKILKKNWYIYNRNKWVYKLISNLIWISIPKFKIFSEIKIIKNILFLSALGAHRFDRAAEYLKQIERYADKSNPDLVRRYYLGLASIAKSAGNTETLITLFEQRVANNSFDFWAWRVLIDVTYFNGNHESFEKLYLKYLEVQKKYKTYFNIPLEVNYYGSYVTSYIGHISILADLVVAKKLGLIEEKNKDIIILDETKIPNGIFFDCIKDNYIFEKKELLNNKGINIDFIEKRFLFLVDVKGELKDFWEFRLKIYKLWHAKENLPILELSRSSIDNGIIKLNRLGISENDWYAVLHVRQANDGSLRDANISTYLQSIQEITRIGGWVIRIGDNNMPKLPKMEKVIDLAHADTQDGDLDIFLLATCRFSIVSNSGPAEIPFYFKKYRILTNIVCIKHAVTNPGDILIPALFFNQKQKKYVKMKEVINLENFSTEIKIVKNQEIVMKNNTSEEIHSAVVQMINFLSKRENVLTENQLKFSQICKESNFPFQGTVSELWANKYANLF